MCCHIRGAATHSLYPPRTELESGSKEQEVALAHAGKNFLQLTWSDNRIGCHMSQGAPATGGLAQGLDDHLPEALQSLGMKVW